MNLNRISNAAHALISWAGVLLAAQAPFTAYLLNLGVPARTADLAFAGVGLASALASKYIDSNNQVKLAAAANPTSAPPA